MSKYVSLKGTNCEGTEARQRRNNVSPMTGCCKITQVASTTCQTCHLVLCVALSSKLTGGGGHEEMSGSVCYGNSKHIYTQAVVESWSVVELWLVVESCLVGHVEMSCSVCYGNSKLIYTQASCAGVVVSGGESWLMVESWSVVEL